jgi:hypothetical protein
MVRRIGMELTRNITQSREGFTFQGVSYNIDIANHSDNLVKVANENYIDGERESVSQKLKPGQEKEFARIEPGEGKFALLFTTSATSHPTTEYNYYINDEDSSDPNLSGNAPWASPPNEYEVRKRGFVIVKDFVSLQISETTGEREYNDVEGWLSGLVLEIR